MRPILLLAVFVAWGITLGQQYTVADFADFTKSPTEHILNPAPKPFVVRSIRGVVEFNHGSFDSFPKVLFEIQGPSPGKQIRRVFTDGHGRFNIGNAKSGTYKFKTTLDGYQSWVGTIIVSKDAEKSASITLQMLVGN